jgi:hypothetical protein
MNPTESHAASAGFAVVRFAQCCISIDGLTIFLYVFVRRSYERHDCNVAAANTRWAA